jgi:CHAT domain-containing protein/Flp pilus assembly protein TadD
VAVVLATPLVCRGQAIAEAPAKEEREVLALTQRALQLYQRGQYAASVKLLRRALEISERLYPASKYPDGHLDLAACLNNLAGVLYAAGDYGGALTYFQRALAMYRRLYPPREFPNGDPNVARCLLNLGVLLQHRGEYTEALAHLREALAMYQRLYPKSKFPSGHPDLAICLNNLGSLLEWRGDFAEALEHLQRSLAMNQRLYPPNKFPAGNLSVAASLSNLGDLLESRGDYAGALGYFQKAKAMNERLYPPDKYPNGHPALANSFTILGRLFQIRGDYAAALDYGMKALRMTKRLYSPDKYPRGHADLAGCLHNLGILLGYRGDYAGALGYFQQALAMQERLYPKEKYPRGHPLWADTLSQFGSLLRLRRDYASALRYHEKALAMDEALYSSAKYPSGHPIFTFHLAGLGNLLREAGSYAGAQHAFQKALAMNERLFPKDQYPAGHPALASCFSNLGGLLQARGDRAGALRYLERAAAINERLAELFAEASSEAQAFAYASSLPRTRDHYLSAGRGRPGGDEAAYAVVWRSKAAITRILERRRRGLAHELISEQVPSARRQEVQRFEDKLQDTRRALARLLLSPPTEMQAHRRHARRLTAEKEELEGQLAKLVPAFARHQAVRREGHVRLVKKLPPGTAFIDLVLYVASEQDPKRPGKAGERRTPSYTAFVLCRGRPVARVELGAAAPVDKALAAWRTDIRGQKPGSAAQHLRRLVWDPLTKHIPRTTRTIFFSPDGALTRLPWAALPDREDGHVLLEDYAVAIVPHGPFLLEELSEPYPTTHGGGVLLALGAVRYGTKPRDAQRTSEMALLRAAELGERPVTWNDLPGTARELDQVVSRAGKRAVLRLRGADASTSRVLAELPRATWAHLATHGFFADAKFRSALQLDEDLFAGGEFGSGLPPGARNPLVLSGLVLAGANRPLPKNLEERLTDDHGILTAETIAGLPLHHLKLAVLSACETGLGKVAGGEGVFGLQRAFHLAGCKNVVASLWKVDDQATVALMALFYDKLWRQKKPPLEALREAQLTLYHHPERIGLLAQERGPNFDKVVRLPTGPDKGVKSQPGGKAATKLWAGFVLSGVGQ